MANGTIWNSIKELEDLATKTKDIKARCLEANDQIEKLVQDVWDNVTTISIEVGYKQEENDDEESEKDGD